MAEVKTYSEQWFDEFIVNDAEDIKLIGELSSRAIHDKFRLTLRPEPIVAIYCFTLEAILKYLKKMQEKGHKTYQINICNVISISYNNLEDDDAEKTDNFMPFIQQIADGPIPDTGITSSDTIELCAAWNSSHISEQPDAITEIATHTLRDLKDSLNMKAADKQLIMPIFCTVHENIINYMKLKRVDLAATSYTLDIAGIYKIRVSEVDDGTELIEYLPAIYTKKTTKDDDMAST